ncbi:alginate O-acetyltransferase AlgX-related protein [Roseobacter sp. S98]|uniref:alginate O-acetyltransferase AlgX-related protein n=1 Tax=Roseobacter algicola (ex Choi et al. 2025) (nom. illeg.) TaxID=3092138 RepID=UPI003F51181D
MSPPSFISAIFALVILAGLGFVTLFDMTNGPGTTRQERIAPTPAPARSAKDMARLFSEVRFYVANRYAMKDHFVTWNSQVKIGLFGHSPAPNVVFGRDGFLFLNTVAPIAMAQGQGRLTAEDASAWRDHFETAQTAFEARGIKYAFVMGPNKHSIYPEYLPLWVDPVPPDRTRTADIVQAVDGVSPAPFDSRTVLQQARASDPGRLLYHPTDTHWTEWGAAIVMDRALGALGIPSERPVVVEASLPRSGDMARMIGQQDIRPASAPVLTARYACTDGSGKPFEITTIDPLTPGRLTCGAPQGRPERIVVFHDSFGIPAIPYLSGRFQKVEFIRTDKADPARAEELGADIVLQITVERKFWSRQPSDFLSTKGGDR